MLKLFSGSAASSPRALPVAAIATLLSLGVHAAQDDAARSPLPAPFERYQRWSEPIVDWRAANARVGEIGGWRTYAREPAEAEAQVDDAKPTQQGTPHGDPDE